MQSSNDGAATQATWHHLKSELFRKLNFTYNQTTGTWDPNSATDVQWLQALTLDHFIDMFKPAWEEGFTKERNNMGWVKEGVIPFTRNELWNLREEKAAQAATWSGAAKTAVTNFNLFTDGPSTRGSRVGPRQASGTAAGGTDIPAPLAEKLQGQQELTAQDFAALSPSSQMEQFLAAQQLIQELRLSHLRTKEQQQDSDTESDDEAAWDGNATGAAGQMLPEHLRKIKLSASNVWNMPGSVTGEQVWALARAKAEEKKRKQREATVRAEEREAKKRRTIVEGVTRGTTLLAKIAESGERAISSFNVKDLEALLRHSDPLAPQPKANKAALLERIRGLKHVSNALAAHQAHGVESGGGTGPTVSALPGPSATTPVNPVPMCPPAPSTAPQWLVASLGGVTMSVVGESGGPTGSGVTGDEPV